MKQFSKESLIPKKEFVVLETMNSKKKRRLLLPGRKPRNSPSSGNDVAGFGFEASVYRLESSKSSLIKMKISGLKIQETQSARQIQEIAEKYSLYVLENLLSNMTDIYYKKKNQSDFMFFHDCNFKGFVKKIENCFRNLQNLESKKSFFSFNFQKS